MARPGVAVSQLQMKKDGTVSRILGVLTARGTATLATLAAGGRASCCRCRCGRGMLAKPSWRGCWEGLPLLVDSQIRKIKLTILDWTLPKRASVSSAIIITAGASAAQVPINYNTGPTHKWARTFATADARSRSLLSHMLRDPGDCTLRSPKMEAWDSFNGGAANVHMEYIRQL